MTVELAAIKLPRKLDSASGVSTPVLAQKTYTFSADVVEYLRLQREALLTLVSEIDDAIAAAGGTAPVVTYGSPAGLVPDGANADGVATSVSRSDHVHATPAAAPSAGIGAGNTEGVAANFARSDHDHKLRTGSTDLTIGTIDDGDAVQRTGAVLEGFSWIGQMLALSRGFPLV